MRQYGMIILIVLPVAILVLIRATTMNHFKQDARKLAEPSFRNSNTLSWEQLTTFKSGYLIIDLDDQNNLLEKHPGISVIQLSPQLMLEKAGQDVLQSNELPAILYSSDPAISARVWMLLSQMGYHHLFILVDEPDNEVMKYIFRPDTTKALPAM